MIYYKKQRGARTTFPRFINSTTFFFIRYKSLRKAFRLGVFLDSPTTKLSIIHPLTFEVGH